MHGQEHLPLWEDNMAETFKVLGQSAPVATTLTDLYTVPASTSTTVSTLVVANRSATATTFRISIAVANAANDDRQYIFYDQLIDGGSSFTATMGVTLAATDRIRVYATLATLSFSAFGVEIT
jgi:hypothetical protein